MILIKVEHCRTVSLFLLRRLISHDCFRPPVILSLSNDERSCNAQFCARVIKVACGGVSLAQFRPMERNWPSCSASEFHDLFLSQLL